MVEVAAEMHLVLLYNKTADLAREAGRVMIEQTDMRLVRNHQRTNKEGITDEKVREIFKIIKKPRAEKRDEEAWGLQFEGIKKLKYSQDPHPANIVEDEALGCLECQDGIACNPETRWSRGGERED